MFFKRSNYSGDGDYNVRCSLEGIPFPVPFAFGRTREAERVSERVAERGGGMGFDDGERVLPLVGEAATAGGGSAAEEEAEAEAAGAAFPLPSRGVRGLSVGGTDATAAAAAVCPSAAAEAGGSVGGDTGGVAPSFLRASKM